MKKNTRLSCLTSIASAIIFAIAVISFGAGPSAREVEAIGRKHETKLREYGVRAPDLRVYAIGKSHIDAAFTWRIEETRRHKVPFTWKQAADNIDKIPGFTYHQSSAQFYEWIKQDDPVLFKRIQEDEKAGRWVIVGGMWVEPDANMPDGESLVRQFLYGQRFFIENFGHPAKLVWLEDTFGFNWNLPQIAAKSGADSFYTLKMLWNTHNQFPFHLFTWQAPDGSRILAHITPILSGINAALQPYFPYDEFQPGPADYFLNPITARTSFPWNIHVGYGRTRLLLKPGEKLLADYTTSRENIAAKLSDEPLPVVASMYGAGDGGHGPTEGEIKDQLALQAAGYSKLSTTHELYADLASYSDRVPVWNDELYLEYHQGVFTTHEKVKRQNREAESRMRRLEAAASIASLFGAAYPRAEITELWKLVLFNQFHDILPGTGIREVYRDADIQYASVLKTSAQLTASALSALAEKISTTPPRPELTPLVVFNPLGWERNDTVRVKIDEPADYRVYDKDGTEVPSQAAASEGGASMLCFQPGSLPGLGWNTYFLEKGKCGLGSCQGSTVGLNSWERPSGRDLRGRKPAPTREPLSFDATLDGGPKVYESDETVAVENELVKVVIDRRSGWMISLFDKSQGREMLSGPSGKILAFTDKADGYPAWNIAEDYQEHPIAIPPVSRVTVTEHGPLFARVLIERAGRTSFQQWITVYRGSREVGLVTFTDLHWPNVLIKIEINSAMAPATIPAEIPYAVIERSTRPQTAWDEARTETPFTKWADLSDGSAGLAVLNFGAHGVSRTPDGRGLRVSIVKSSPYPRPELSSRNVDYLYAWRLRPAIQTDQGEHWSYLALLPHSGDWRQGKVYRAGYEYNTPAFSVPASAHAGTLPASFSPIRVTSGSVIITSIKKSEDDDSLILRLVEFEGSDTEATLEISSPFHIQSAFQTNLLELDPRPLPHSAQSLTVPIGHFEIKTVKLLIRED